MNFILVFLLVTIIVLFVIYYKKKEGFVDTPVTNIIPKKKSNLANIIPNNQIQTLDSTIKNLNIFANGLSTIEPEKVTAKQMQEIQTKLLSEIKDLSSSLNLVVEQMKLQQNNAALVTAKSQQEDTVELSTSQLLQNKEIEQLTNRLNNLKSIYQSYLQEKKVDEQTKIPIYSSCIVAEASGGYSLDNVNKPTNNLLATPEKPIVYSNQKVVPGVQTYNPTKDLDINTNSFSLDDIINQLSQSAINVNFNV